MYEQELTVERIEPTYQQTLVDRRMQELFQEVNAANDANDRRAEKLAAISGAIVAFVGGAGALGQATASHFAHLALFANFLLAAFIFYKCGKVWSPAAKAFPTVPDLTTVYAKYISQSVDDAYHQALNSLVSCIEDNLRLNAAKADAIDAIMRLLCGQIVCVAVHLLLLAFASA